MTIPETLYTIDIVFASFVLLFVLNGLRRGLAGELASLLTLLFVLGWICFFLPSLTQFAAQNWSVLSGNIIQAVVLVIILLVAVILSFLMTLLFRQLFKERVGAVAGAISGGMLGWVRGGMIGLSLMAALSLLPNEALYTQLSEKSTVGEWVCDRFTPWLYPRLMELPVFDEKEN